MHTLSPDDIDNAIKLQGLNAFALDFSYQGQPQHITPGIYFGMPEDLYHSIPALSSTGLKNLLISAPDFYFNSWLNPMRDDDQEDGDSAKEWRRFGKASHTRNLEGKKTFDSLYCVEFLPPEGCLDTVADLKRYCIEVGIDTKGSSKWGKSEWISAVKFNNPNVLIYDVEREKYYQETGGKIQLTETEMRRIEIAAAMIEKHPELRHAFTGGYAEVTVIWIENGLWFKARFDYLKPRAIVDLKTFTNKRHKPIDMALHETMAAMKYHIQVGLYTHAAEWASGFARAGISTTYSVDRFGPDADFLKNLGENKIGHEFYNVFQKKGGAPLARGKKFSRNLNMMACANASINIAIDRYKEYSAEFGTGIWVDKSSISDFEDALFPVYATEI